MIFLASPQDQALALVASWRPVCPCSGERQHMRKCSIAWENERGAPAVRKVVACASPQSENHEGLRIASACEQIRRVLMRLAR